MRNQKPHAILPVFLLFALPLAVIVGIVSLAAAPAFAQDDAADVEDEIVEEEVEEAPAAETPSAETAAGDETAAAPQRKSYLRWTYESLGLLYTLIFLALSFTLVALIVMNLLTARRDTVVPPDLIEGFEAQLNAKKYQEAYELAKNDDSFLGKVLSAGLSKITLGYNQAIEAMQEVGEDENMKLDHQLSYIALIGSISPMVGLLGTVHGMIMSFNVIATATAAPKPSELAAGISTALFTTLVGLIIAIPAIAAYNILRNRIARLVLETGIISENLMSRFQNVGGKRPEV